MEILGGASSSSNNIIADGDDILHVFISNSSWCENAIPIQKRFSKYITITEFKRKLELVTGGSASTMKLEVYDEKDQLVCELDNNDVLLGTYPIKDNMRIHVVDKFVMLYEFTNTDNIDKYTIPEHEYDKKPDTVRAFLQKNKLGKYNEEEMKIIREQQEAQAEQDKNHASLIHINARCEVKVPNQPCRRATVMYNGTLKHLNNNTIWIGVKYDEPLGKNDGCIDGVRYFTCPNKYGGFVKPTYVTVGDFPEETFDLDDEI